MGEAGAKMLEANTRLTGTQQNPNFLAEDLPGPKLDVRRRLDQM